METRSDGKEDTVVSIKDKRQRLETRIGAQHNTQLDLLASLQTLVPDIVSSLDLSLKVVCSFNGRPFTPSPPSLPPPNANPNSNVSVQSTRISSPEPARRGDSVEPKPAVSNDVSGDGADKFTIDESGSPLSVVRSMVAVCLLERVPFTAIDSSAVLRKLENDTSATAAEKAALRELGGESGAILAVEMALRSMAEDNGGVELEEFVMSGKSRVMVLGIDRTRLVKELPESAQYQQQQESSSDGNQTQSLQRGGGGGDVNSAGFGMGGPISRPMPDMWMGPGDAHLSGLPPMFPGAGGPGPMLGPRGGSRVMGPSMMGIPRGMGVPPLHRPPLGPNMGMSGPNASPMKPRTEEDDLKDLEALLNKKSFRELQKSKTGEELLDLIHRPTARETAVAAKVFGI